MRGPSCLAAATEVTTAGHGLVSRPRCSGCTGDYTAGCHPERLRDYTAARLDAVTVNPAAGTAFGTGRSNGFPPGRQLLNVYTLANPPRASPFPISSILLLLHGARYQAADVAARRCTCRQTPVTVQDFASWKGSCFCTAACCLIRSRMYMRSAWRCLCTCTTIFGLNSTWPPNFGGCSTDVAAHPPAFLQRPLQCRAVSMVALIAAGPVQKSVQDVVCVPDYVYTIV